MNVRFCPNCRSLILAEFRYCPYCGVAPDKGPDLAEALAEGFDKMDEARQAGMADLFSRARESLDRLESDMDLILEELEKEGRPPQ